MQPTVRNLFHRQPTSAQIEAGVRRGRALRAAAIGRWTSRLLRSDQGKHQPSPADPRLAGVCR